MDDLAKVRCELLCWQWEETLRTIFENIVSYQSASTTILKCPTILRSGCLRFAPNIQIYSHTLWANKTTVLD